MSIRAIFFLVLTSIYFASVSHAQVQIVQISDTHSKLDNWVQVLNNIDHLGQNFLQDEPEGEFIVYFNGDVTGINLFSEDDKGLETLLGLKLLRERGYTVVFNVGNHDSFDWASPELNEAELFLSQMKQMQEWGVILITSNIKKPVKFLQELLSPHYKMKGLAKPSYLLGLTIKNLLKKSNLTKGNAATLFRDVIKYKASIVKSIKLLKKEGVKDADLFIGVHKGHTNLAKLAKKLRDWSIAKGSRFKFPLLMAGDDHLVSSYRSAYNGPLVSNAGSHGGFNLLSYSREGELLELVHYEVEDGASTYEEFNLGARRLQSTRLKTPVFLSDYADKLSALISRVRAANSKPLFALTKDIEENKHDMKVNATVYGSMIPEALRLWAGEGADLRHRGEVIVAMSHSSSYRTERRFKKGEILSSLDINEIYPFPQEVSLFRMTGREINKLFKALKKSYAITNPNRYTPQLSLNLRETSDGSLEFLTKNKRWKSFKPRQTYLVAFDAWLSMNRFGEGPELKEWIKAMSSKKPLQSAAQKDILLTHWLQVLESNGFGLTEEKSCSIKLQTQ